MPTESLTEVLTPEKTVETIEKTMAETTPSPAIPAEARAESGAQWCPATVCTAIA